MSATSPRIRIAVTREFSECMRRLAAADRGRASLPGSYLERALRLLEMGEGLVLTDFIGLYLSASRDAALTSTVNPASVLIELAAVAWKENCGPTREALDEACKQVGTQEALAALLGIKSASISGWRERGRVPADRCLAIERATGGRVTCHALRPDVFPVPASNAQEPGQQEAA